MEIDLTLVTKSGQEKNFPLASSVTVIGRRQDCDLCIPMMNISRRHCQINQDENSLKIRDLSSRNGTFVNGEKIEEAILKPGDSISIGTLNFCVKTFEGEMREHKAQKLSSEFLKSNGEYDKAKDSKETQILKGIDE